MQHCSSFDFGCTFNTLYLSDIFVHTTKLLRKRDFFLRAMAKEESHFLVTGQHFTVFSEHTEANERFAWQTAASWNRSREASPFCVCGISAFLGSCQRCSLCVCVCAVFGLDFKMGKILKEQWGQQWQDTSQHTQLFHILIEHLSLEARRHSTQTCYLGYNWLEIKLVMLVLINILTLYRSYCGF